MGLNLQQWAETKSAGSYSQRLLWNDAITRMGVLKLQNKLIEQLLTAASQQQELIYFTQMFQLELSVSESDTNAIWRQFLGFIDDSDFELGEWLKSILVLGAWLTSNNRKTSLLKAAGYIACSMEAAGVVTKRLHLSEVVQEMLERYGFEG